MLQRPTGANGVVRQDKSEIIAVQRIEAGLLAPVGDVQATV
jgi:hypothetical protein